MTVEKPPEGTITVATNHQVLTQTDTTHYSVRRADWKRLRQALSSCDASGANSYQSAGWTFVGVAASALLGIVGLYSTESANVAAWVKPSCWSILIATTILAVAMHVMARDKRHQNARTVTNVEQDMGEIEDSFYPERKRSGDAKPSEVSR